jgi:hypothetical protein
MCGEVTIVVWTACIGVALLTFTILTKVAEWESATSTFRNRLAATSLYAASICSSAIISAVLCSITAILILHELNGLTRI